MDLKVAFTSQDVVPDVEYAFKVAQELAERLHIAHRPAHLERQWQGFEHGFLPLPEEYVTPLSKSQRQELGIRKLYGAWYRSENGPMGQSPYYRHRVGMLERGQEAVEGELEATGFRLALHPNMFTFELRFITMYLPDRTVGPFVGGLMDWGQAWFPYSEIEERTGLFGPLVHMQLVEFLAALRRIAIPSLYIRDPSGYLEHGDSFALLEAMDIAGMGYQELLELMVPNHQPPEILDKHQLIPDLSGSVGSAGRVRHLEEFLFTQGIPLTDIDSLIEQGR
jgi:hypothetical protein